MASGEHAGSVRLGSYSALVSPGPTNMVTWSQYSCDEGGIMGDGSVIMNRSQQPPRGPDIFLVTLNGGVFDMLSSQKSCSFGNIFYQKLKQMQHVQHRWITFQIDEMSELSQNYNKTPPGSSPAKLLIIYLKRSKDLIIMRSDTLTNK